MLAMNARITIAVKAPQVQFDQGHNEVIALLISSSMELNKAASSDGTLESCNSLPHCLLQLGTVTEAKSYSG